MFHLADIIENMNRGRTARDIDSKLKEMLDATAEHGRGGELTVKLKVVPTKRGVSEVTASVSSKLPTEKPEASIFFVNEQNQLVRDDPRQPNLPGVISIRKEDVPEARQNNA